MENFTQKNIQLDKNPDLILFLRNLADSIELFDREGLSDNSINMDQLQKVGEFYMSYKMTQSEQKNIEYDTADVIKFVTLGWYIYCILLDKDKESNELVSKLEISTKL